MRLLTDFPPDKDGELSLETLLEAYDSWKNEDIKEEDLITVFNMITSASDFDMDNQDELEEKALEGENTRSIDVNVMKVLKNIF